MKLLPFALVVLFASTVATGSDWPQWRGPGGQGVSDEERVPMEWTPSTNIAWKTPLEDQAALEAVKQRRFEPAMLEGKRVPVIMTVAVLFSLAP